MTHVGDRLVELALGNVPADDRASLEAHLAGCAECRDDVAAARGALAELALGLDRRAPGLAVRARLGALVRGTARLLPFVDRVARLFDLAEDQAEGVLSRIDDPSAWAADGVVRGGEVMLVSPGPAFEGAIASLIRLGPGARYPRHRHRGEERLLFLQGGVEHDDGSVADAGTLVTSAPGTVHGFQVLPGASCVAAVLLLGGVDFEDDAA